MDLSLSKQNESPTTDKYLSPISDVYGTLLSQPTIVFPYQFKVRDGRLHKYLTQYFPIQYIFLFNFLFIKRKLSYFIN